MIPVLKDVLRSACAGACSSHCCLAGCRVGGSCVPAASAARGASPRTSSRPSIRSRGRPSRSRRASIDDVVNLTPPGAEPHDIELSPSDVETIRDAELVVYIGGGFQPALEDAVESRDGPLARSPARRARTRTSGSTRSGSPRPSSASREASAVPARRTTRFAEPEAPRRGVSARARRLRARRARDDACSVRPARAPLRADRALARRPLAGVGARARASSRS